MANRHAELFHELFHITISISYELFHSEMKQNSAFDGKSISIRYFIRKHTTLSGKNANTKITSSDILRMCVFRQPAWRNGRAYDSGSRGPGFETRLNQQVFPLGKEISRHC